MRLVIDTNLWISRLLLPSSALAQAVRSAARDHSVLMSDALLLELAATLERKKFDRYLSLEERRKFLHKLHKISVPVTIIQHVAVCRDAKDDMILELALNGKADAIISGDKDVLALHPFRGIPIMTAAEFMSIIP